MDVEKLSDIKVEVEKSAQETGNLPGVLAEIKYALEQLLEKKKTHCIDLRAMPWSPGEQEKLEKYLGQGEVRVALNALGKSTFTESRFSGVWIVSHFDESGEIIGHLIEITHLPDMIFSQTEDIRNGLERLQSTLFSSVSGLGDGST